jgi:hypothetical protein
MALGALIGAYQEDDQGSLRALFPLAGRTLIEFQARCAAAVGASPIVVLVERIPAALQEAIERLRGEGMSVVAVSNGDEAASRFEAGTLIVMIADGLAPDAGLIAKLVDFAEPAIALVPDDEVHRRHERIDATSRWAGVALVDSHTLGATAAMLGDWDLQSTLLRRIVQNGARRVQAGDAGQGSILVFDEAELADFEKHLLVASRGVRSDWASRYVLPLIEEFATERLMETRLRPEWLVFAAMIMLFAAAFGFSRGWLWQSYVVMLLSTPLDLVAQRLAALRLRPMVASLWTQRMLWPAAGLCLIAIGWVLTRNWGEWGPFALAVSAAAFAQAGRTERAGFDFPLERWLFSRRNAILAAGPFVVAGWWGALLTALLLYAGASFFITQHFRHRLIRD